MKKFMVQLYRDGVLFLQSPSEGDSIEQVGMAWGESLEQQRYICVPLGDGGIEFINTSDINRLTITPMEEA